MNTLMFGTATIHIIQLAKSFFLNALSQFDIETGALRWELQYSNAKYVLCSYPQQTKLFYSY
jgi:hypothetical protein